MVDVVDTSTQQPIEMTMTQWTKYFATPEKDRILNVISLEFSHTGMDRLVEPPELVRKIDWVNVMWPPDLIEQQTDTTNNLDDMKYPKVRKYVLMSVGGCYTDFHIDFGGTSVWYHILKGEKIFWVIEPTEDNLSKYEKWTLSTKQEDVFFGDLVDKCCIVNLKAGDTFMIPSGWIHAVYTPADSLVFGGNFIHSYSISQQIQVSEIEHRTKVPNRFRFPFYPQIHWYAAKRYTELLEKDLELREPKLEPSEEFLENKENYGNIKNDSKKSSKKIKKEKNGDARQEVISPETVEENQVNESKDHVQASVKWEPINLTDFEANGVKQLIKRLQTWDRAINNCPPEISEPQALLDRLEELVELHENDDPWLAARGVDAFDQLDLYMEETGCPTPYIRRRQKAKVINGAESTKVRKPKAPSTSNRKRRLRCGDCDGCNRGNCGDCKYCLDMPKFGGPGKMKQSCIYRICLNPTLPTSAKCNICNDVKTEDDNPIMECSICANLAHPACFEEKGPCKISETLNNCWECPNCCKDEEAGDFDANLVRGKMDPLKRKLAASVGSTELKEDATKKRKRSSVTSDLTKDSKKTSVESDSENESESDQESIQAMEEDDSTIQQPKKIVKPKVKPVHVLINPINPHFVVRPRPLSPPAEELLLQDGQLHPLSRSLWLKIFGFLSQSDISICMRVCRNWNRWGLDGKFWNHITYSSRKLDSLALCGIVRRQPLSLNLAHCSITFSQMKWLLSRLPRLQTLSLEGNSSAAISAMVSGTCPLLEALDISYCEGVKDHLIRELLSPARDAVVSKNNKGRLSSLKELKLSCCDITDESLKSVSRFLPSLEKLDLSYCTKLTDAGIDALTNESSICRDNLTQVNVLGCTELTIVSLQLLKQCAKHPRVFIEKCDKLVEDL
eukprot:gene15221-6425_t